MICELALSVVLLGCPDNVMLDEAVPELVEYVDPAEPEPEPFEFEVVPANMTIDEYKEEYVDSSTDNNGVVSGGGDSGGFDATVATVSSSGIPWDRIAECESGYGGPPQWDINTGNGFYGGLQFEKASWDWAVDVGGHAVPEWPHHATRGQQISVAETLASIHPLGIGAWPACTKKLGLR